MTEKINGWYLPHGDGYFAPFIKKTAPKKNGFQREHLIAAFKHVRKWDVAIDVGAHVGFWTLDMAEKFDRVFAFEPSPTTFDCLCKNITNENVQLVNAAVGDKFGTCEMSDDRSRPDRPGNTGSRFIDPKIRSGSIEMVMLDGLKLPGCDLLKIDVEGFEYQVLMGAERLIRKRRPVVIMECDKDFSFKRYGIARHESQLFLLERGYMEAVRMRPDRVFIPG